MSRPIVAMTGADRHNNSKYYKAHCAGLITVVLNSQHIQLHRSESPTDIIASSKYLLAQVWPVYIYTHGSAHLTLDYH